MNRREVLQRVAALMGGALTIPAFAAPEAYAKATAADWKPSVLDKEQFALVSRIVDLMLPRTDTPGALDVGVPAFIDTMLKAVCSRAAREQYLQGLRYFDAAAQAQHGKPFLKLEAAQQKALIQRQQEAAIADEHSAAAQKQKDLWQEVRSTKMLEQRTKAEGPGRKRSFILTTKELALLGFFTSEPGATQVLQYVAIPGAYHGCVPVNQAGNGKRWAT